MPGVAWGSRKGNDRAAQRDRWAASPIPRPGWRRSSPGCAPRRACAAERHRCSLAAWPPPAGAAGPLYSVIDEAVMAYIHVIDEAVMAYIQRHLGPGHLGPSVTSGPPRAQRHLGPLGPPSGPSGLM